MVLREIFLSTLSFFKNGCQKTIKMYAKQPLLAKRHQSIAMANAIIHFDNAIYGYLVPIIAPLFFPKKSMIVQYTLGYGLFITSFVAKPFGVLFFSKIAQTAKEIVALRYTLLGVGTSLIAIGALPTYAKAPIWRMIWLLSARMCIEACSAGEHTVAHIYLLKEVATKQAQKLSVFYEISSMVGILLALAVGTLFAWIDHPVRYWRVPFVIAGLLTLLNVVLFRLGPTEPTQDFKIIPLQKKACCPIYRQLWKERKPIVRIAIAAGFSYVSYTVPFLFMNSFVPMVTDIAYPVMMAHANMLMIADLVLLGWLGKVCQKYDHNNLMAVASGMVALSIIPLLGGLRGASIFYVTVVRCWLIFWGVIFACFLTLWSKEQVSKTTPYLTIGFATVLGSSLLGKSATAICFYLFYSYKSPVAPACYIALLAFITTLIMAVSSSE